MFFFIEVRDAEWRRIGFEARGVRHNGGAFNTRKIKIVQGRFFIRSRR